MSDFLWPPWTVAYQAPLSVHGIFQARVLEWVAISFSRESSRLRDRIWVSWIVGSCFYCLSHQGSQNRVHDVCPQNSPPNEDAPPASCSIAKSTHPRADCCRKEEVGSWAIEGVSPDKEVLSFLVCSFTHWANQKKKKNFFLRFLGCWPFIKVFIEFVTILLLFYILVSWLRGMWVQTPCIESWRPQPWTTREAPWANKYLLGLYCKKRRVKEMGTCHHWAYQLQNVSKDEAFYTDVPLEKVS